MTPDDADRMTERRWSALLLLSSVYALNFADRQVIAVLAEPIKLEMGLSDFQLSLLTGTLFALFYSTLSIPIAWLADRKARVRIIACACFLWSLCTTLSGLATTFLLLALARIGVAVGEAGCAAPSYSLIGDYFPKHERVRAISLFTAAAPVGILIGTMGGGLIAGSYGWRTALLVLGGVGLVAAPLLLASVREPKRGAYAVAPQAAGDAEPFAVTASAFFSRPGLRWLLLAVALYSLAGNAVLAWTPALLIRQYGASLGDIAFWYGLVVSAAFFLGLVGSGEALTRILRRSERAYALLPAGMMLLFVPFYILALNAGGWMAVVVALFVPLLLLNGVMAPALALVQELYPPRSVATATALLLLALNLVGLGAGPLIIGLVSDALAGTSGTESLYHTILFVVPLEAILCAAALFLCARHLPAELAASRRTEEISRGGQ